MKKQIPTAQERWPELDIVAGIIEGIVIREINNLAPHIKSKCNYKRQAILEMTIDRLEKCV